MTRNALSKEEVAQLRSKITTDKISFLVVMAIGVIFFLLLGDEWLTLLFFIPFLIMQLAFRVKCPRCGNIFDKGGEPPEYPDEKVDRYCQKCGVIWFKGEGA